MHQLRNQPVHRAVQVKSEVTDASLWDNRIAQCGVPLTHAAWQNLKFLNDRLSAKNFTMEVRLLSTCDCTNPGTQHLHLMVISPQFDDEESLNWWVKWFDQAIVPANMSLKFDGTAHVSELSANWHDHWLKAIPVPESFYQSAS